jgi:hypothetical protein
LTKLGSTGRLDHTVKNQTGVTNLENTGKKLKGTSPAMLTIKNVKSPLHANTNHFTKLSSEDCRILEYIAVTDQLKRGNYNIRIPTSSTGEVGRLGQALQDLAHTLETRHQELQQIEQITTDINTGLLLDQILERVYQNFRGIIPFNRIGFALIEPNRQPPRVQAHWAKSDQPQLKLEQGYSASLTGTNLETILATGQPRILNDLVEYLAQKPDSSSTQLIVAEGMRSSLTCPLIVQGVPVGFIFFSSITPYTYAHTHVDIFKKIAGQLSVIFEKGRLVSELTAQKTAIEHQNEQLRHLNELKNKFLGMAAHDLRGPLSNIQMASSLLTESGSQLSPEEATTLLKDITAQASYMINLVNELLDVTQIEAGKFTLKLEQVDLASFLSQTVKRQAQLAISKATKVRLMTQPSGIVLVDPTRLRQVVDNLISNAVKFSPPGSLIKVYARQQEAGWWIGVQDSGPGITSEDRQRLFQDFSPLSAKPTAREKSIGLGLSIARQVVEAHGGQIGVDSEPGQGATFWFILPPQHPG